MRAWLRLLMAMLAVLTAPRAHASERLLITVVTREPSLATFEQRVSSWFTDGTQVTVVLAQEVTPELVLTTTPGELRVCVVPRDSTRALVTFATLQANDSRHLLRDVRLRDGFDEIGLERLASVIHSATLALREGVEGAARADTERDLTALGVFPPKIEPPVPPPSRPPLSAAAPSWQSPKPRKMGWLVGAEYGIRARGGEGVGHGPGALLGLQLPSAFGLIDVLLRVQSSWRSSFDAGPLTASLQTTALRGELGFEPQLGGDVFFQAFLGGGVDVARISVEDADGISTREPGQQLRGVGELAVGIWRRTPLVDVGVVANCSFLLSDVHYSLTRSAGQQRLITPWPVQPALSLQARFRGPL